MSLDPNIPKPTIQPVAPESPPVTLIDVEETTEAPAAEAAEPIEATEAVTPDEAVVTNELSSDIEADLGKRFLGFLIDAIVAIAVAWLVGVVTGSVILEILAAVAVMLTRDSLPLLEGQSFGKKMMKTQAVKLDGSSLESDWVTGAIRNLTVAHPLLGFIEGFIFLTRSGRPEAGLRLGDGWAKTKVISLDS